MKKLVKQIIVLVSVVYINVCSAENNSAMLIEKATNITDDEFLTFVQEATFKYFYEGGHPVSGLIRDRYPFNDCCASGGTGMGLMAIIVGVERDFISRNTASKRVLKILNFLKDDCERQKGVWSHWINGKTGASMKDGRDYCFDLVETAYVVQGLLSVHQYFNKDNIIENKIRNIATQLWREVEWDWYLRLDKNPMDILSWGWSKTDGWKIYDGEAYNIIHGFNETMIVYLLAIASPTHGISADKYINGWVEANGHPNPGVYKNNNKFYGYNQYVTHWRHPDNIGMPLFFTHYSYLGFDPRGVNDGVIPENVTYFDVFRNISLIDRAYCIDNPGNHKDYGPLVWGLTASDDPNGYNAHCPINDNGTITPSAAISAIPYVPEESIATMKHFYAAYKDRLWGKYGFKDAFNIDKNWFADSYLAIDQGPIIIMIENYRTQLLWNLFMSHPDIKNLLNILRSNGWSISQ
jgi:hypothetical protein